MTQPIELAKIRATCENCNLSEICLPRGLNKQDLERLDDVVKRSKPLHKGDVLFRAGDPLSSLYAVRSGSFKLTILPGQGEEQVIGFYLPGEIMGLDGIETHSHSCTAVALETSTLCAFSYSNLSNICKHVPSLQEQLLRLMGRELSEENRLLLTVTQKSANERIATFLLSLSSRYRQLGYSAKEFKLSMSRAETGSYLGLTIETVSRGMNKFQKQGLIELQGKHIKILDQAGLSAACNEAATPAHARTVA